MGFPNSTHIRKFTIGKTIESITQDGKKVWMRFTDGTSIRLCGYSAPRGGASPIEYCVTPFNAMGEVEQSVDIMNSRG